MLLCPLFELKNDQNLLCVIQCAEPKTKGGKKSQFRLKDEIVLSVLSNIFATCLSFVKLTEENKRLKKKFDNFSDMSKMHHYSTHPVVYKICAEATLPSLSHHFKEVLPKFLNFTAGGVLFYNTRGNFSLE
jgi:hypothetical protein